MTDANSGNVFKANYFSVDQIEPFRAVMTFYQGLANRRWSVALHPAHLVSSQDQLRCHTSLVGDVFKHKCLNKWLSVIHFSVLRQDSATSELQWSHWGVFLISYLFPLRPREHHLSVSAGTRRTHCAVVVGPKPTTSRSPPVASVGTPRSARESVSDYLKRPYPCFHGGEPCQNAVKGMTRLPWCIRFFVL